MNTYENFVLHKKISKYVLYPRFKFMKCPDFCMNSVFSGRRLELVLTHDIFHVLNMRSKHTEVTDTREIKCEID